MHRVVRARGMRVSVFAAALVVMGALGSMTSTPVHAQQTASVSIDYDALDPLPLNDGPIVIPPEGGKAVVLHPPHGVARYTPPPVKYASLAPYVCPCARKLVLKPVVKKKRHHPAPAVMRAADVAPVTPAAQVAPVRTAPIEAPPPPAPKVVAPKPQPEPAPVAPKATPVAPPPPPKIASAPSAPPPAAPPATHPTTTQWGSTETAPAKVAPPPAPPVQVLTPPPVAKAPEKVPEKAAEKVEEKVAAAPLPAPVPAPAPAKPVEITKPAEVAALPPPAAKTETKTGEQPVVISYAGGGSGVPADSVPVLKGISDRMAAEQNLRVQLFSYASDAEKNVSRSRRLSLERAVAVRKLLIDNGLDSTRIEVRALGDQNNGGETDRVDVVLTARR